MKLAAVYMMAARDGGGCLHIDVTSDLPKRLWAHRNARPGHPIESLPDHKLVYYEITRNLYAATVRLREIMAGPTGTRGALIRTVNPEWQDLTEQVDALVEQLTESEEHHSNPASQWARHQRHTNQR